MEVIQSEIRSIPLNSRSLYKASKEINLESQKEIISSVESVHLKISILRWGIYFLIALAIPIFLSVFVKKYLFEPGEIIIDGCCSGPGMTLAMISGLIMALLIRLTPEK